MTMTVQPTSFPTQSLSTSLSTQPNQSPTTPVPAVAAATRSLSVALAAAVSLALILVLLVIDGDAAAGVSAEVPTPAASITVYVVQPGDTLWGIARGLAGPDTDIRPLVDELKAVAGGADLQIGQQLILDVTMLSHNS